MSADPRFIRLVVTLGLCSALGPLALQVLVPALPAIRDEFAATVGSTQLLLSAFSATLAVAVLVYGFAANRWDKRNVLGVGFGLFAIGSMVCFVAGSVSMLVLGRVLQAAGAASASTITRAVAAESFSGAQLQKAMSVILMIVVVGPMIAPVFGGLYVQSENWRGIFLMLFAICAALFLFSRLWISGGAGGATPAASDVKTSYWQQLWGVLSSPVFRVNMLILVAVQVGVYAFIAVSPFLVIGDGGYSATSFGFLFMYLTAGYMAGTLLAGSLARRLRPESLVLLAAAAYTVGAVAISGSVLGGLGRVELIVLPAVLMTFANGITQPTCGAAALGATRTFAAAAGSLSAFLQLGAGGVGFQIVALFDGTLPRVLAGVVSVCAAVALGAALRQRLSAAFSPAPGAA